MSGRRRLLAEHVVGPDGVLHDAVVEIDGPRLVGCGPGPAAADAELERVPGWVVPGFVDTHVHGGGGADYATEDPAEALRARAFHARHGTTTSFASLVTAPVDVLCRQLAVLAELVGDGHFAGVHLEGPFLSPAQRGAHDPALLRPPSPADVERLLDAADGALALVTLAPELPGALDAIVRLTDAGVRVAVGHTDSNDAGVAAALDAGATVATHLFNAMRGLHHREPGPVPRLTTDPRVAVEVIADGFHLHPEILRLVAAAAGPGRTMLVTDAMVAAGMPDGSFRLGGLDVAVVDGMARLVRDDGTPGSIAGSTLTMAAAFERMTAVLGRVDLVAAMAASTPAERHGLTEVGRLAPGCRADLCVVDDAGRLRRVMRAGRWFDGTEPA
jgi:N-acetylglucosamine-6-phosphate deacetylase